MSNHLHALRTNAGFSLLAGFGCAGLALALHEGVQSHTDRVARLLQPFMQKIVDSRLTAADLLCNVNFTQAVLL